MGTDNYTKEEKEFYESIMKEIRNHQDFGKRNPVDIGIECGYSEDDVMKMIHMCQEIVEEEKKAVADKKEVPVSEMSSKIIEHTISQTHDCYITTAVCRNADKADDCYELQTFRKFRDYWLQKQPDGKMLINRYYLLAPKIVELIDASEDRDKIYDKIYKDYLEPCLQFIERGEMEKCKEHYSEMVCSLVSEYLLQG